MWTVLFWSWSKTLKHKCDRWHEKLAYLEWWACSGTRASWVHQRIGFPRIKKRHVYRSARGKLIAQCIADQVTMCCSICAEVHAGSSIELKKRRNNCNHYALRASELQCDVKRGARRSTICLIWESERYDLIILKCCSWKLHGAHILAMRSIQRIQRQQYWSQTTLNERALQWRNSARSNTWRKSLATIPAVSWVRILRPNGFDSKTAYKGEDTCTSECTEGKANIILGFMILNYLVIISIFYVFTRRKLCYSNNMSRCCPSLPDLWVDAHRSRRLKSKCYAPWHRWDIARNVLPTRPCLPVL